MNLATQSITQPQTTIEEAWLRLRQPDFYQEAHQIILQTAPSGLIVDRIVHVRSAHYGTYKVEAADGSTWLVRIGVIAPTNAAPTDNSGYLGTSTFTPTGQKRQYDISLGFSEAGGQVCEPGRFAVTSDGFDVMWLPFIEADNAPISASQWYEAITSLHTYRPIGEPPVFTNRAKSFARLSVLPKVQAEELAAEYDDRLKRLFTVATKWSMVHGDAHGENAINTDGRAMLFDLDTACWAPSVWDITHLLRRAGSGVNNGYDARELRSLFSFTDSECEAAMALRETAVKISSLYNNLSHNFIQ